MQSGAPKHRVYSAMNRPRTLFYAERRLFLAAALGAATLFIQFQWLLGGVLFFAAGYLVAVSVARIDPRLPEIVLLSVKFAERYDPAKPGRKAR